MSTEPNMAPLGAVAGWMDDRVGLAHWTKKSLNKIFPDHWSFMIGEIALYSFIVVILTGVYLTFFFNPSLTHHVYHGAYKPLDGQSVSDAYTSVVNISLFVRGGIVIRQMHHWSADIFIGAIVLHMCRIYFTGAFRRPRELNWVIGVALLFLALVNGYLGYSLPDDLISGTGVRIMFSVMLAIPVVGTYLTFFFFGGNFPGTSYDYRLYIIHVFLLPGIIVALLAVHLGLLWHQKHTQFRGHGATERNVVGTPVWPGFVFKTTGLLMMIFGITALLGGLAQINPIWLYGPYVPYNVTYLVQPDWYMGWLDGALRLMPRWEVNLQGHMIPTLFFPAVLMPGVAVPFMMLWPWIEAKFTKDNRRSHHLLERPRDAAWRTAIGVGVLTFFSVLFIASSTDLLANFFAISLNVVLPVLRYALVIAPFVAGFVTFKICRELSKAPEAGRHKRPSIISRTPEGGYTLAPSEIRPGDGADHRPPIPVPSGSLNAMADGARQMPATTQRSGQRSGQGSGQGSTQP
ncbi:MAG: cytochrome bc1 complex cytochrome b subunit [Acidimicrobiales bacterium]